MSSNSNSARLNPERLVREYTDAEECRDALRMDHLDSLMIELGSTPGGAESLALEAVKRRNWVLAYRCWMTAKALSIGHKRRDRYQKHADIAWDMPNDPNERCRMQQNPFLKTSRSSFSAIRRR